MTTGNVLHLLMVCGVFALFSEMLAYQSWAESSSEQTGAASRAPGFAKVASRTSAEEPADANAYLKT